MGFEAYNPEQLPPSIAGDFGQLLASASGALQDEELDLLSSAAMQRLPARCADDALDTLGEIFRIGRYAGESHDSYRARLVAAWPTWEIAGSAVAIETQVRAYGIPDVRVIEDHEATLGLGSWWSRFVVTLGPDFGVWGTLSPTLQGSPTTQGAPTLQGVSGGVTIAQIRAVKRIVLKWKSAHSYPLDLVLLFDSSPFVGAGSIPGSYVNAAGDYLTHIPIGKLVPLEAPTTALPYQI